MVFCISTQEHQCDMAEAWDHSKVQLPRKTLKSSGPCSVVHGSVEVSGLGRPPREGSAVNIETIFECLTSLFQTESVQPVCVALCNLCSYQSNQGIARNSHNKLEPNRLNIELHGTIDQVLFNDIRTGSIHSIPFEFNGVCFSSNPTMILAL